MGAVNGKSLYQTPTEKALRLTLEAVEVDDSLKDAYVRQACADIQSRWTERERLSRCRWAHGGQVETPMVHHDHRRKGVGVVIGE